MNRDAKCLIIIRPFAGDGEMAKDKKQCSRCGKPLSFLSKFIVLSYENEDMLCLKCSFKYGQESFKDRREENDLKDITIKQTIPDSSEKQIKQKSEIEKAEIEKALIDSGLFKADASNWIPKIILSNIDKGSKVIDLAIRKHGVPLSVEEKRQHGIRGNAKVSKEYLLSLTDEGKKDPIRAAFIAVQPILHKWSMRRIKAIVSNTMQLNKQNQKAKTSYIEMEIELCCAKDDRTCKAALELDGTRFPQGEAPDLPLPDCDSEYCRCLFLYHTKKRKL